MRCERAEGWFSRARDGELTGRQRRRLAGHLRRCAACREEYRRFRVSCRLLQRSDPARGVAAPPGLADAVVARLWREPSTAAARRWRRWMDPRVAIGIAATLALLLWGDRLHVLEELHDHPEVHVAPMEP